MCVTDKYHRFMVRRWLGCFTTVLLGDHSEIEPPETIPNSEVKPLSADGSVGLPHVRVGHCQACYLKTLDPNNDRGFFFGYDFCHQSQSSYS